MKPVRLAIADDSTFVRKALQRMVTKDTGILLVGSAASGEELLEHLDAWRPDVITLDLSMPGMGGMAALDQVMARRPTPVIILSTHSGKDAPLTLEALHHGAVDFIDKQQYSLMDFEALRSVIVETVLQVVGARPAVVAVAPPERGRPPAKAARAAPVTSAPSDVHGICVIGASTGGPPAIQSILDGLGGPPPVPVAIVQHMPRGFTKAFASRLSTTLPFPVREAQHAEVMAPGVVYIAPAGQHLQFLRDGNVVFSALSDHPQDALHRPSVDVLFQSAASVFGSRAVGVLLTGMGADGALGMVALRAAGAVTLGQNEATCIVYGMPRAAAMEGALQEELGLPAIAPRLRELFQGQFSRS